MKNKKIIATTLIFVTIAFCIVAIFLAMQGEIKQFGQNPDGVIGQALICENNNIDYSFFTQDNSNHKNLKITTNFYNEVLSAISLDYTLYYNDANQVKASEAHNHAAMNISFGKDGLSADAFNANYSKMENSMKMSLYANTDNIKPISAKYFMIDTNDYEKLPSTIQEYQANYEKQGFTCTLNNK